MSASYSQITKKLLTPNLMKLSKVNTIEFFLKCDSVYKQDPKINYICGRKNIN